MSEHINNKLLSISKDKKSIKNTVLSNIVKMLTERGLLDKKDVENNIKLITSKHKDNMEYNILLKNKKKFFIKFIQQKITAINKSSGIHDFVEQYKNNNNIVIVNEISSKAHNSMKQKYKLTEVFTEKELMMNIIDHIYQPKFEILKDLDIEKFLHDRKCEKKSLPRIFLNDPIVKYYNLNVGNIIRILRPSGVSGEVASYRLVVNGKMNK